MFFKEKEKKLGSRLGKTTGWIHRLNIKKKNIHTHRGVNYTKIDQEGLHFVEEGRKTKLKVDNIIICAGQKSLTELLSPLQKSGIKVHLIGGAKKAVELDAEKAIREGFLLGTKI